MDNFADERDRKILEKDKYTFFVLRRVIGGRCRLLLTDHERLILCFTEEPFPVWIWTPDDASAADMERAYQTASERGLLDGAHHFNLKQDLAAYFIRRAALDGKELALSMRMLAYDCRRPVRPETRADGAMRPCGMDDLDRLVDVIDAFQKETGIDKKDRARCRIDAEAFIRSGNTFFWENAQGAPVASCKLSPNGDMAALNLVYTWPAFRRRHYAQNLVYGVTRCAIDQGYVPMLYTDADYIASNACYERVGYVLRGKLCTIG